ncbi:MAG: hypothetical protein MSA32_02350 [Bacteroidales bacterium]|nr:hypothetical protein [Bacteroidales bacterium]
MRGRKLPEADKGKKRPPCYEADDRLTPDEQGLEADEGGKLSEADERRKSPCVCSVSY